MERAPERLPEALDTRPLPLAPAPGPLSAAPATGAQKAIAGLLLLCMRSTCRWMASLAACRVARPDLPDASEGVVPVRRGTNASAAEVSGVRGGRARALR